MEGEGTGYWFRSYKRERQQAGESSKRRRKEKGGVGGGERGTGNQGKDYKETCTVGRNSAKLSLVFPVSIENVKKKGLIEWMNEGRNVNAFFVLILS